MILNIYQIFVKQDLSPSKLPGKHFSFGAGLTISPLSGTKGEIVKLAKRGIASLAMTTFDGSRRKGV